MSQEESYEKNIFYKKLFTKIKKIFYKFKNKMKKYYYRK